MNSSPCVLQLHDAPEEAATNPEVVHVSAHSLGQLEQLGRDLSARNVQAFGSH